MYSSQLCLIRGFCECRPRTNAIATPLTLRRLFVVIASEGLSVLKSRSIVHAVWGLNLNKNSSVCVKTINICHWSPLRALNPRCWCLCRCWWLRECVFGCCPRACHECGCAHPCSCFCFCAAICCCWCGAPLDIWGAQQLRTGCLSILMFLAPLAEVTP